MPIGKPLPLATDAQIIDVLDWSGHLAFPFGKPNKLLIGPDKPTSITDPAVKAAVASYQDFNPLWLDELALKVHGRSAHHDGEVGPATRQLFSVERCGHPDYPQEEFAVGSGNWKGCHSIGNFHAMSIKWDLSNQPARIKPLWSEILARVTAAYAELGLQLYFDGRAPVQIAASFVPSSSGWIGLASVLTGMGCQINQGFARFLNTYLGGSTDEQIITQLTTLLKHEFGHNCGLQHSRGGVMNASIVNGLPVSWKGDPHHSTLVSLFGGQPIPSSPTPPPPSGQRRWFKPLIEMEGDTEIRRWTVSPADVG